MINTYNGYDHGRIRCDTSIQSIFQTTPSLWTAVRELAIEKDITIHMHICETASEINYSLKQYNKTPITCFAENGIFDAHVCAAHSIYVSPEEAEILSAAGSSVIHDPCSNLKCCCGFANLKPFTEKHINIGLGTDGVCSNNSGDLFETMKFTALNQKMLNNEPDFLSAAEVLRMAVHGGLHSQKRVGQAGILAPGYDADLIAIDLHHPGMLPLTSPESNLVYSASGRHVIFTMVRGQILYNRNEFMSIDMEKTVYQNNNSLKKLKGI